MDNATLTLVKELGIPAFSVFMLIVTAGFMIRWSAQDRVKSQEASEAARDEVREVQKSFTNQLLQEQVSAKQREAELQSQLTRTNQRIVELQLEMGQVRNESAMMVIAVERLTKERDQKQSDYEHEVVSRQTLEKRVSTLESELENTKDERKELNDKYNKLKKEHDILVSERSKRISTQTVPKVE